MLALMTSPEYGHLSPRQPVPRLVDEGRSWRRPPTSSSHTLSRECRRRREEAIWNGPHVHEARPIRWISACQVRLDFWSLPNLNRYELVVAPYDMVRRNSVTTGQQEDRDPEADDIHEISSLF
jgi:hypothetical protein